MPADIMHNRARVAAASRWGNAEDKAAAVRDLAAANLEKYIQKVVSDAPPLTDEQREHLAALLMGGAK